MGTASRPGVGPGEMVPLLGIQLSGSHHLGES